VELHVGPTPDQVHQPVQQQRQTERDDHDRKNRGVLDRTDQGSLDHDAAGEGDRKHDRERLPEREPLVHEGPGDEGREGRHLALREVDDPCRAVDDHDRKREPGVDRTFANARRKLLRELGPGEGGDRHQ
jgi:hypothetical protein